MNFDNCTSIACSSIATRPEIVDELVRVIQTIWMKENSSVISREKESVNLCLLFIWNSLKKVTTMTMNDLAAKDRMVKRLTMLNKFIKSCSEAFQVV